jgi:NADPH:quinone reductase-like Zn-dependent oxidoreductase
MASLFPLREFCAGGVGSFAVQLAHWRGAHVIGTASSVNLTFLRSIGADESIDYTATRFEDVVDPVLGGL